MDQPLRILHLEDNPSDALLTKDQLDADGLSAEIRHVMGRADFEKALLGEKWDLVLSDYHLPNFTGMEALKLVREKFPPMPFILMSGTIGERAAIESLKAGATDYVLKQNRDRLPSAVRRAVIEAAERIRREQAESELRQSEKQYRLLFQGNPNPMWVFDLESMQILEVNEAAVGLYGFAREKFLSMTLADLRAPDKGGSSPGFNTPLWEAETQGVVWKHRHEDGTTFDVEVVWRPLAFRGRLAALAMATDVTARRQAMHNNAVFARLSQRLSAVSEESAAATIISEAADELFNWDDFSLDLYSAENGEVVSLLTIGTINGRHVKMAASAQARSPGEQAKRVITHGAELSEAGGRPGASMIAPIRKGDVVQGFLAVHSRASGAFNERHLQTLQILADQCSGALERIRAEEELRCSQRRFHELFENSPDAILVEDMSGNVLDVNRGACELHGLGRGQLIGKNSLDDLVPPARREGARVEFARLASGELTWIESETLRADGTRVPVEIRVARIEYDGKPALLFHVRDVSGRHAAEEALRVSETLLRSVWDNSVDGMQLTDESGIVMLVNDAFCRLTGLARLQLEGRPFTVIYSTDSDWGEMLVKHRQNFADGKLRGERTQEVSLHDGRRVILDIADAFVESYGERRFLLSLFRDITSQKKLEEQYRQAQKLEAIGQLAGGIAHDFNNILTVIIGHSSLLTNQKLDERAISAAQQIKQAAERAAALTRQLLAFGRKQMALPRLLDLNQVVGNMTQMLGRLLGEDIALHFNFSNTPALIEADLSMMEQILLNFSVNSRDAMPHGGHLTIAVSHREIDQKYASQFVDAKPGKYICLSHVDNGSGIPPENLTRIFEPFFTTKELGKGTGLGLATVFGIVKQHQGWMEVESELGKGTTFHVFLPAATVTDLPPPEGDTQHVRRKGTETILVVEDERDLRDLVSRVLRNDGYRVFEAVDGQSALQIWNQHKEQISLVFTDVIMPGGLNGRELANLLWAERPDLKVIFSSGYGAETLGKDFKLDPHFNYLQKPYEPGKLAKTIRSCLDGNTD
jgi:PAS domain S-box-containing protein